jgi:hypothetical protein
MLPGGEAMLICGHGVETSRIFSPLALRRKGQGKQKRKVRAMLRKEQQKCMAKMVVTPLGAIEKVLVKGKSDKEV